VRWARLASFLLLMVLELGLIEMARTSFIHSTITNLYRNTRESLELLRKCQKIVSNFSDISARFSVFSSCEDALLCSSVHPVCVLVCNPVTTRLIPALIQVTEGNDALPNSGDSSYRRLWNEPKYSRRFRSLLSALLL
jgi:hypothetical protein